MVEVLLVICFASHLAGESGTERVCMPINSYQENKADKLCLLCLLVLDSESWALDIYIME